MQIVLFVEVGLMPSLRARARTTETAAADGFCMTSPTFAGVTHAAFAGKAPPPPRSATRRHFGPGQGR